MGNNNSAINNVVHHDIVHGIHEKVKDRNNEDSLYQIKKLDPDKITDIEGMFEKPTTGADPSKPIPPINRLQTNQPFPKLKAGEQMYALYDKHIVHNDNRTGVNKFFNDTFRSAAMTFNDKNHDYQEETIILCQGKIESNKLTVINWKSYTMNALTDNTTTGGAKYNRKKKSPPKKKKKTQSTTR